MFVYYWNKTGRMIFGVFGEAIDKFAVRVVGNHFAKSRLSHVQVISVVSGVPINSLKRLVTSSTRPWLSLRKVSMVWGKLVFSFSRWPSSKSTDDGLWTCSKGGSPPALLLLPPRPSLWLLEPVGQGNWLGGCPVSSGSSSEDRPHMPG